MGAKTYGVLIVNVEDTTKFFTHAYKIDILHRDLIAKAFSRTI